MSSYSLTIGGQSATILASTLDIELAVGERSVGTLSVLDTPGVQHFQEGMQVVLLDGTGATAFTGYVLSSYETHPTGLALLQHDITLMDKHYLADKRRITKAYASMLAGDILTDICANYLAVEGVVGYHSLRTETLQSDWQLINGGGALDTRLDATSAPGDLKLKATGPFSKVDNTQTAFNLGTNSSTVVTATPDVEVTKFFYNDGSTLSGWTNSGCSVVGSGGNPGSCINAPFSGSTQTYAYINAGMTNNMTLEFDVFCSTGALGGMLFLCNSSGVGNYARIDTRASGTPAFLPSTSFSTWGTQVSEGSTTYSANAWHHLRVVCGSTTCQLYVDGTAVGSAYTFANNGGYIAIESDGAGGGSSFDNITLFSNLTGVYTSAPVVVDTAGGSVNASTITWASVLPSGTSIAVQTRYSTNDGGSWSGYTTATSGSAVPSISGLSTTQMQIQYQVTLTASASGTVWASAQLTSMTVALTITLGSTTGQRVSPLMTLTPTYQLGAAVISWTATTPTNTTLVIETSINGGSTWSAATNGGAIAGLTANMLLAGVTLLVRQTLSSTAANTTPTLSDLTVRVTSSSIQDGVSIVSATWDYENIATNAIDKLAGICNYWWQIDSNNRMWFMAIGAVTAPFSVSSSSMLDQSVGVTNSSPLFRNRQIVRGVRAQTSPQTETRKGDGATRTFTLSYPLAMVPSAITVNGTAKTLGIKGIDTGKDFYWSLNDPIIAQDAGGTLLTSSDTFSCTYVGSFASVVQADDLASQILRGILEGGTSGIVENVVDVPSATSTAEAFQIADTKLTRYTVTAKTVVFDTYTAGLLPGQLVTVTIPEHAINAQQMLVSHVAIKDAADAYNIIFTVTAVIGPADTTWVQFFDSMASPVNTSSGFSIGSNSTLNVLVPFTETWSWSETVTQNVYACPICGPTLFCGPGVIVC